MKVGKIDITEHCLERYKERFEREVRINGGNVISRIKKDVSKGNYWHSFERDIYFVVYNQLKVYVTAFSNSGMTVITVFPYTKKIKYALNKCNRTKYLNAKGGGIYSPLPLQPRPRRG